MKVSQILPFLSLFPVSLLTTALCRGNDGELKSVNEVYERMFLDTVKPDKCAGYVFIKNESEIPKDPTYTEQQESMFWSSPSAQPGEKVLIKGAFSEKQKLIFLTLIGGSDIRPGQQKSVTVSAENMGYSGFNFDVPADFPMGVYRFEINKNPNLTGYINRPVINWLMGLGKFLESGSVSQGDSLQIFGRNLPKNGNLILQSTKNQIKTIPFSSDNSRHVSLSIPSDLTPGLYSAKVSFGNLYGLSSDSTDITVVSKSRTDLPVKEIVCDKLIGDGITDNSATLIAYLNENASAQVEYHFKIGKGSFVFHKALFLKANQYLEGNDSKTSILIAKASDDSIPDSWIGGERAFGMSNMTVEAPVKNAIVGNYIDIYKENPNSKPSKKGDITMKNVIFICSSHNDLFKGKTAPTFILKLIGSNVQISNCTFDTRSRTASQPTPKFTDNVALDLIPLNGCLIENNTINSGDWGVGMYIRSYQDVIVRGNTIKGNGVYPGAASGISVVATRQIGCSKNIYITDNFISTNTANDQEAITSDGGGGSYFGHVKYSSPTITVLTDNPSWGGRSNGDFHVNNYLAMITGGMGAGQSRYVKAIDVNSITVNEEWKIPPDSNSVISIFIPQSDIQIVNNYVEKAGYLQFYGGVVNSEISNNTLVNTLGINLYSGVYFCACEPLQNILVTSNQMEGNEIIDPKKNTGVSMNAQPVGFISGVSINNNKLSAIGNFRLAGPSNRIQSAIITANRVTNYKLFNVQGKALDSHNGITIKE